MIVLDRFFLIWEIKKVVDGRVMQEVVLNSNDCMGMYLGGISVGRLREVVV